MMLAPQSGRDLQETPHPAAHGRPPLPLERAVVFWVRLRARDDFPLPREREDRRAVGVRVFSDAPRTLRIRIPGTVKRLLPPRQSRGISQRISCLTRPPAIRCGVMGDRTRFAIRKVLVPMLQRPWRRVPNFSASSSINSGQVKTRNRPRRLPHEPGLENMENKDTRASPLSPFPAFLSYAAAT